MPFADLACFVVVVLVVSVVIVPLLVREPDFRVKVVIAFLPLPMVWLPPS